MGKHVRFAFGVGAFLLALVVGLVILQVLPANWRNNPVLADFLASLPSALLGIAILVYHSYDKVYFFVQRTRLRLDPRAVIRFEIAVELGLNDPIDWSVLRELFEQSFPDKEIWSGSKGPIFPLVNAAIRAKQSQRYPEAPDTWTLQLASNEIALSFGTLNSLVDPLARFFESVKRRVEPVDEKYVFKVRFTELNPYLGLFLQRTRVPDVITFDVMFEEYVGGKREVIRILPDEVQITARSVSGWEVLGKKYALLSTPPIKAQQ